MTIWEGKKRTRFIRIEYVSLGVLFIYFYSDVLLTSGKVDLEVVVQNAGLYSAIAE